MVDTQGTTHPRRRGRAGSHRRRRSFWREIPFLIAIALILAFLIKAFLFQAFRIPSGSMEPTLMPGDRVLVSKLSYRFGEVERGDVIVFQNPSGVVRRGPVSAFLHSIGEIVGLGQTSDEDLIKRVIGLPGDTIEIRDRTTHVNGEPLHEPYLTREARELGMQDFGPVTVPDGAYFVMGDNRARSLDSRFGLGMVPEDKVIGRAVVIIWPPSDVGGLG